jgi:hypothetical protein
LTSRAIAHLKADLTGKPRSTRRQVELLGPDAPVLRPLAPGLLVTYVVDEGEQFTFVQHRHLEKEGCSEDELHAVALENLAEQASGSLEVAKNSEVFAVLMGGNFEASMMLLDDVWDNGFQQFVSGDYVVACPARDVMGFCDARSAAGVQELLTVSAIARDDDTDHPLSDRLYRRVGGGWEVFDAKGSRSPRRRGK